MTNPNVAHPLRKSWTRREILQYIQAEGVSDRQFLDELKIVDKKNEDTGEIEVRVFHPDAGLVASLVWMGPGRIKDLV